MNPILLLTTSTSKLTDFNAAALIGCSNAFALWVWKSWGAPSHSCLLAPSDGGSSVGHCTNLRSHPPKEAGCGKTYFILQKHSIVQPFFNELSFSIFFLGFFHLGRLKYSVTIDKMKKTIDKVHSRLFPGHAIPSKYVSCWCVGGWIN